ncbi:heat shock protein HspQ [bacterium]|jgi:heat shock protein HspQ|nr:heat shock protein HspQ [bacterium]
MDSTDCKFSIGQYVHHTLFDYRGMIVDVDPTFSFSEEWYEQMTTSDPPKDAPWYHVLVDGEDYSTYVAERNLEADSSQEPINNPLLSHFPELEDSNKPSLN